MNNRAHFPDLRNIEVIAPNFKRRHSGVTSTIIRLAPILAKTVSIVTAGVALSPAIPNLSARKLLALPQREENAPRVWHARRNIEMVTGLALKKLLRKNMKLVFTSAAQRHHTRFTRILIRHMDALIATSAKSASYLENDAQIIAHGVDCKVFTSSSDRLALRQKLALPTDGLLIGCFGRIRPQKGTDLFVQSVIEVCNEVPSARALVMGRATAKHSAFLNDLKTRIAMAGLSDRVMFRDEVPIDQLASHFQALDLFVAPQRWEGFGLTVLEAMACGVPVIATRVGAFDDMILHGKTGYLVDIDDGDAITHHLRNLLLDAETRNAFAAHARKRVTAHFPIEKEASALEAVYRRLLSEP